MLTALRTPVQRLMLTLVLEGLPSPLFNCVKFYTSYFQKINHLFLAVTLSKSILIVIYCSNGALKTDKQFKLGSSVTLKFLCLDVSWAGFLSVLIRYQQQQRCWQVFLCLFPQKRTLVFSLKASLPESCFELVQLQSHLQSCHLTAPES